MSHTTPTHRQIDETGVFWRWEQLRVLFNVTLIAVVVAYATLMSPSGRMSELSISEDLLSRLFGLFLFLNLGFFLGTILETMFSSVGLKSVWLTSVLFMVGLFLASFLTLITLFSYELTRAML